MAMLERACKMLADQFIGGSVIDTEDHNNNKYQHLGTKTTGMSPAVDALGFYSSQTGPLELLNGFCPIRADCSTESCLTSHESAGALTLEGSPAAPKNTLDSAASLIWNDTKAHIDARGIAGFGM